MPTKKSVGCHDGSYFLECLAAQYLSFDGQVTPLIIAEQDAFLAELLFEYLVLSPQVLDNILLTAVDPTRDDEEQQVPGLQDGFHVSPDAVRKHRASGIGGRLSIVRNRDRVGHSNSRRFSHLQLG